MSPEEKQRFVTAWVDNQLERATASALTPTLNEADTQFVRGTFDALKRFKVYMETLDKREVE